jgi:cell division protein FtsQ
MAKKRRKRRKYRREFDPSRTFWNVVDYFRYRKSLLVIAGIVTVVILAGVIALKYIADNYTVTNVYVTGNTHYSNEEIMAMVIDGELEKNSVYLSLKYRNKSIENIPFIEKMSVEILAPDTIRINVYEKAIAGYIQYLGRYMYFDRDGIVVESSMTPSDDVPQVLGLNFNHVIIHEKLPVEREQVFAEILDITKLLSKYSLHAEKIFFDSEYNVYLYFGSVEVSLGTDDYIDEKIIQLQYILPSLEGKTGILEMKDYDEDTTNITFEEKKQ